MYDRFASIAAWYSADDITASATKRPNMDLHSVLPGSGRSAAGRIRCLPPKLMEAVTVPAPSRWAYPERAVGVLHGCSDCGEKIRRKKVETTFGCVHM